MHKQVDKLSFISTNFGQHSSNIFSTLDSATNVNIFLNFIAALMWSVEEKSFRMIPYRVSG